MILSRDDIQAIASEVVAQLRAAGLISPPGGDEDGGIPLEVRLNMKSIVAERLGRLAKNQQNRKTRKTS